MHPIFSVNFRRLGLVCLLTLTPFLVQADCTEILAFSPPMSTSEFVSLISERSEPAPISLSIREDAKHTTQLVGQASLLQISDKMSFLLIQSPQETLHIIDPSLIERSGRVEILSTGLFESQKSNVETSVVLVDEPKLLNYSSQFGERINGDPRFKQIKQAVENFIDTQYFEDSVRQIKIDHQMNWMWTGVSLLFSSQLVRTLRGNGIIDQWFFYHYSNSIGSIGLLAMIDGIGRSGAERDFGWRIPRNLWLAGAAGFMTFANLAAEVNPLRQYFGGGGANDWADLAMGVAGTMTYVAIAKLYDKYVEKKVRKSSAQLKSQLWPETTRSNGQFPYTPR